jgi:hypothetical protein
MGRWGDGGMGGWGDGGMGGWGDGGMGGWGDGEMRQPPHGLVSYLASRTIWVCVTTATTLPASERIRVCQT